MSRIQISPATTYCQIDGIGYTGVSMEGVSPDIHAIQWYENNGWTEPVQIGDQPRGEFTPITSMAPFQKVIDSWNAIHQAKTHPPAPTPDQITAGTIQKAVEGLSLIGYLTTVEMQDHITVQSRQEIADYIHAVGNILATAQQKFGTGEAYAPSMPPTPTPYPVGAYNDSGSSTPPYIQFVTVN